MSALDAVIWAVQGILAAVFLFSGAMKLLAFDRYIGMVEERSGRDADLSRPLMTVVGVSEVAGGLGLILPWATGIMPVLTPLAALGLAVIMIGATDYHRRRGEPPLPTVVLLVLALIVAVTRFGGM